MLQVRKMKISLENKGYPAVLFFGIATSSKHEGCGYMRLLLNHVLSLFPDHIQLIQAYNWDLYRSLVFHEQYTRYTWKLDKNAYVKCNGAWNTNPVNKDLLSAYQNFTSNKMDIVFVRNNGMKNRKPICHYGTMPSFPMKKMVYAKGIFS